MRYTITDEIWTVMGPLVEAHTSPHGPASKLSERMFFETLLYIARTGVPWRDLPGDFGDWSAVFNRLRRWVESGRFKNLFRAMTITPGCEGLGRVFADSTLVRAHHHSAGERTVAGLKELLHRLPGTLEPEMCGNHSGLLLPIRELL